MHDQLFENQDSFGLRPWSEYGRAALVADLLAFNLCVGRADTVRRIEEGKRLGTQLEIKATPTLIVNGWMLGRPPSVKELDALVQAILAGRSPMTAIHQS
jgi:protein-disulfide isomerase